jgi:hypothetical protein
MDIVMRFRCQHSENWPVGDWASLIQEALGRFDEKIQRVQLVLVDVNGPKGGLDKECRLVIHPRRMPPIVIHDRDSNPGGLIHRVAGRASYAWASGSTRGSSANNGPAKGPSGW